MGKWSSLIVFVLLFAVAIFFIAVQQLEQISLLEQEQQQRQAYEKALSILNTLSPPASKLLQKHGIDFAANATLSTDGRVNVQLSFDYDQNKVMYFLPADRYGGNPNEHQFLSLQDGRKFSSIDWQSGGENGVYRQRFSSTNLPEQLSIDNLVLQTQAFYAVLVPYDNNDNSLYLSGLLENMKVGQTVSYYDVQFKIHELEVSDNQVIIRYSQTTPVEEAGLYLLYFNIIDPYGNYLVLPQDILKTGLSLQNPREFIHDKPQIMNQEWGIKVAGVIQVIPPFKVPLASIVE